MKRLVLIFVAAVLTAAVALVTPTSPAGAAPPVLPNPNSHGITLTDWREPYPWDPPTAPRFVDATMRTAAVFSPGPPRDVKTRILLPANYDPDRATGYPVLYLLHGGGGTFSDWADFGDLKAIVQASAFKGIVVLPEGGKAGFYSDWYGRTDGLFRPLWETFHVEQLVPWVDDNFNTVESRSGRAVAGLSMGASGALFYGGKHADLFGAVGSFSGGTDINHPGAKRRVDGAVGALGAATTWGDTLNGSFKVNPPAGQDPATYRMEVVFGPPSGYPTKNPVDLADSYRGAKIGIYAEYSPNDPDFRTWGDQLHGILKSKGIADRYCTGTGGHEWAVWKNDLRDWLGYVYGTTPSSCPNGWGAPVG